MFVNKALVILALFAMFLTNLGFMPRGQAASGAAPSVVASVIAKYQQIIPEQMRKQRIPGFSIALVDSDQVLWSQAFGYTDWDRKQAVTPDTPFSIQSMSKSFTALGVLFAVQDGLVDLNTPISQYLPDFHVNSIFEAQPESKMTLAHLLSHTAGFTHEAPVGNNYDSFAGTFDQHAATIQDTWLKYPVGSFYAYSNLGIDLAALVVEKASGMPFQEYVRRKLLAPLGMANTSLDIGEIRLMTTRAIGHTSIFTDLPLVAMMPSGGVYSSANDMARYIQFHLRRGLAGDLRLLDEQWIQAMYTPQFQASSAHGYGLGIGVNRAHNTLKIAHGGGGFGFLSMMTWYPELNIGLVWLSNSTDHDLQDWLSDQILDEIITGSAGIESPRLPSIPYQATGLNPTPSISSNLLWAEIHSKALPASPENVKRWQGYTGTYSIATWGRIMELHEVRLIAGYRMTFDGDQLAEVQPGLLFTEAGEALDLRSSSPTYRNLRMAKIPASSVIFYRVSLVGFGLFFAGVILGVPAAGIVRRIRRTKSGLQTRPAASWQARAAAICIWLACLAGLLLVVVLRQFPFFFYGTLAGPNPNLPAWQQVLLSLPYVILVLAAVAGLLTGLEWKRLGRGKFWNALGVAVLLAFVVVLLIP